MSPLAPQVERFADAEALSKAAAEEFVRLAQAAIAERGRFCVALTGGSTPRRMYRILAEEPLRDQVEWERVHIFFGDERAVPPSHQDSNFRMASVALLHSVPLAFSNVRRMEAERSDLDAAARDYEAAIAAVFQTHVEAAPPAFDLILMGMGEDGHTASLFPHTTALAESERWVVANHVPKLEANRMTMTTAILNQALEMRFLVAGAGKATALAEVLEGPPDPERLPSQLIRPLGGKLVWMVDEAAAAQLQKPEARS